MMRFLGKLFRRVPKGYNRAVEVRYQETRWYEGYIKRGDQLFTNEAVPLGRTNFFLLVFWRDGIKHQFIVKDDGSIEIVPGRSYRAYINAASDRFWFEGREGDVHRSPPDDPEEDDEDA